MRRLLALVLFAGGGLMDFAVRRRFEIAGAVDREAWALAAYRQNHPGVPTVEADLVKTPAEEVLARLGVRRTDYLHASPPCAPWSAASLVGCRYHPDRFTLLAILGYLKILRPPAFSMENVMGLVQRKPGRLWMPILRGGIARLGYRFVEWHLDAWDFGAPQRRERWFLVGVRGRRRLPTPPRPTHGGRGQPVRLVLRDVLGGLSEREALSDGCCRISPQRRRDIAATRQGNIYRGNNVNRKRRPSMACPIRALPTSPSILQTTIAHPRKHRCISVREYARIQRVPDYRFPDDMPADERYRTIGEGNPPTLMDAVLASIMEVL